MPGQNAFAFNGTAFVPEDRNLTAGISAFSPAPTKKGVTHVYTLQGGPPATQVWQGFPPTPTAPTYTNVRTGTFPNLANSIRVNWTADESTITASFSIFVKIGAGAYSLAGTATAGSRTFTYGNIPASTTYSFYVRANGVSGLNSVGPESSTSLPASPAASTNFRETSTSPSSITWTWDFPAGTFQRFYVYRSGTYNTEVLPTQSATSATHTWSGLSENSSYTLSIQGQNYDGFWSPIIADAASTTNAAPSAPGVSVVKVDVASSPVVRNSTISTQTRSFIVTVDPSDDPLFAEVYLEASSDNVNWSEIKTWTDNTNSRTHTHSVSTTAAITRYYRARQRDSANLYSGYSSSVSATSDAVWSHTEQTDTSYAGAGSETNYYYGYDSDNSQTLSVTDWAVTSTFNDNVQDYGGDQAFDSDLTKAWRSKSVTNARIRIEFNNSGNWVNGISAVRIRTAAAYTYYLQVGYMSGTTEVWFNGSSGANAPGTTSTYVESGTTTAVALTTIDVNPDRMVVDGAVLLASSVKWLIRFVFTASTARTFEVNEITPKMRRQNYTATAVNTTWYW